MCIFSGQLGDEERCQAAKQRIFYMGQGMRGSKWSRSGAYENVSPVQMVSSSHDHREWSFVILVVSQHQGWFWSNSFNHQLHEKRCYIHQPASGWNRTLAWPAAKVAEMNALTVSSPSNKTCHQHKLNIPVRLPAPFKAPWKGLGSQGLHGPNGIRPHGSKLTRAMGKLALGIVASPADETDGSTGFQPSPDPSPDPSPVSRVPGSYESNCSTSLFLPNLALAATLLQCEQRDNLHLVEDPHRNTSAIDKWWSHEIDSAQVFLPFEIKLLNDVATSNPKENENHHFEKRQNSKTLGEPTCSKSKGEQEIGERERETESNYLANTLFGGQA